MSLYHKHCNWREGHTHAHTHTRTHAHTHTFKNCNRFPSVIVCPWRHLSFAAAHAASNLLSVSTSTQTFLTSNLYIMGNVSTMCSKYAIITHPLHNLSRASVPSLPLRFSSATACAYAPFGLKTALHQWCSQNTIHLNH